MRVKGVNIADGSSVRLIHGDVGESSEIALITLP